MNVHGTTPWQYAGEYTGYTCLRKRAGRHQAVLALGPATLTGTRVLAQPKGDLAFAASLDPFPPPAGKAAGTVRLRRSRQSIPAFTILPRTSYFSGFLLRSTSASPMPITSQPRQSHGMMSTQMIEPPILSRLDHSSQRTAPMASTDRAGMISVVHRFRSCANSGRRK